MHVKEILICEYCHLLIEVHDGKQFLKLFRCNDGRFWQRHEKYHGVGSLVEKHIHSK